jgi:hypothetical protein
MSARGRFCCKSLFALAIKISFGRTRDFRVKMWGTSSPEDKLTGDLANEPDATSISDRGLFCLLAGNLSPGVFRLLQQNRHKAALASAQPCPLPVEADMRAFGRYSAFDTGCVKTLRGIITPAILGSMAMRRATKPKNLSSARYYDQFRFRFHTTKTHLRHGRLQPFAAQKHCSFLL